MSLYNIIETGKENHVLIMLTFSRRDLHSFLSLMFKIEKSKTNVASADGLVL